MRKFALVVVCVSSMTSLAHAGLQSALTTALINIQGIRLIPSGPHYASPEGSLFIDPIASTRGEGVFREGPDFSYDPTTGSVAIFAPPMLGPADEFGVRQTYSPESVTVYAEGSFAASPTIPQLTKHQRTELDYSISNWEYQPFEGDAPSFVVDENNDTFNLHVSSSHIEVYLDPSWRSFSGAELQFNSLLEQGLTTAVFDAAEGAVLDNSIWPFLPHIPESLPEVYFVVNYQTQSYSSVFSEWYGLLAVPREGAFPNAIPEPSGIALAALSLTTLFVARRRS